MPGMPVKIITGDIGQAYHETQPSIPGYTNGQETGLPSEGTIPVGGGDVYFHYVNNEKNNSQNQRGSSSKNATITIHYINDETGQEMSGLPVRTITGNVGQVYDETQPSVLGYTDGQETGLPSEGIIPANGGNIYFHYILQNKKSLMSSSSTNIANNSSSNSNTQSLSQNNMRKLVNKNVVSANNTKNNTSNANEGKGSNENTYLPQTGESKDMLSIVIGVLLLVLTTLVVIYTERHS